MLLVHVLCSSSAFLGGHGGGRPQFTAVRPAATAVPNPNFATARSAVDIQMQLQGVPLTGQTLAAALKLRCDNAGAAYAIYWTRVRDEIVAAGSHVSTGSAKRYVDGSMGVVLDALGDGPIASVKRSQHPMFIPDVISSDLKRKDLAFRSGVSQVNSSPRLIAAPFAVRPGKVRLWPMARR
jgi:hypothetical protein